MGYQVKPNGGDVVSFLKAQHKEIKALFEEVVTASGTAREEKFRQLCRLLTRHEAGEEAVVHPAATRALKDGEAIVAARLSEETEAKRVIAELKELDPGSDEFDTKIRELQGDVLVHAEHEEKEEFNKLAGTLDHERLMRMRKTVERTESLAGGSLEDTDPGIYDRATTPNRARGSVPTKP